MRTDRKFDISGLKFDKRLIETNYKNNSLSPDEYQSYLAALPDMESNAEAVQLVDAPQVEAAVEPEAAQPMTAAQPMAGEQAQAVEQPTTSGFGTNDGGGSSSGSNTPPFGSGY